MSRVVGYVRVSTLDQVDNFSLEAQRQSILAACTYHGHELVQMFADEGKSAFADNLSKRPALQEAIDLVVSGGAEAIIVDKLDRLARNARIFHEILGKTKNRVIFVREGIDPTTPTGELVAGVLASSAQFFSRNLGVETKKGKDERVKSGLWLGELPYGYRKQEGDIQGKLPPVLDDTPILCTLDDHREWSRVDAVRHVFTLAASGLTRRRIIAEMQRLGFADMGVGLVASILPNRFYLGELAYAGLMGIHPPLIDAALFDAARRSASSNRRGGAVLRRSATPSPLSGLVQCGKCGAAMHTMRDKGVARLLCSARCSDGSCTQISVKVERIEHRLVDLLHAYAPPADIADRLALAVEGYRPTDNRRALEAQRERIKELYEWGHLPSADFQAKLQEIEQRIRLTETTTPDIRGLSESIQNLAATYWDADDVERNALVSSVFTRLLVDNQELVSTRVQPDLDRVLRARHDLAALDLATARSSGSQVKGFARDSATEFRPLPDGWWAVPLIGGGLSRYPKIPRAWWPRIAEERAQGLSGPAIAKRWGISPAAVYQILSKHANAR